MSFTKKFKMVRTEFEDHVTIQDRVARIAANLNNIIQEFNEVGGIGAEAFSEEIVDVLKKAGLCKVVWLDVECIGVHPENRSESMLIPIDVHDLLWQIVVRGWVWKKCSIMAYGIPTGLIGENWKAKNVELTVGADGLLAACNPSLLKVVTARGSHTCAAVRCMKYATRGVHPEICGADGCVSQSKIFELQPTMALPLESGVPVDVIDAEVATACPKLMEVLSRVGNAHKVGRMQTSLQDCKRIHRLRCVHDSVKNERIIQMALIGKDPELKKI